jgi:hypothetical protein
MIMPAREVIVRVPITGHAVCVSDTVKRAMAILKDREDPATKPSSDRNPAQRPTRRMHFIGDRGTVRNDPWLSTGSRIGTLMASNPEKPLLGLDMRSRDRLLLHIRAA